MTAYLQSTFLGEGWGWFLANLILILLIALPLMLAVAMIIYLDRKIWAAMALRRGPNVVGPFGLLQSFADGLKVFLKETIIPSSANPGLFLIAPILTFTVALVAWAVVPFGEGMVLANINVGLLYLLAVSSLGVYGIIIAGWASNSKYPFYSALRAAAQMVSYEVSIGFVLIPVVLWAGTFNLSGIVMAQQGHVLGFINGFGFNPLLFPMAVIFLISAMAETARAPFDLTEAESELVAGYQTEYSSMSFALFWLGEYGNVLLMCGMNAVLFWGGWLPPVDWAPLYYIPGIFWFFIKIFFFFFVFSWVKATVPRYRYDQLMRLGWKIFLPISLIWVFLVSGYLMVTRFEAARSEGTPAISQAAGGGQPSVENYACREMIPPTAGIQPASLRVERRGSALTDTGLSQWRLAGSSQDLRSSLAQERECPECGSTDSGALTRFDFTDGRGVSRAAVINHGDVSGSLSLHVYGDAGIRGGFRIFQCRTEV